MDLQFSPNEPYQRAAIDAVLDLFAGHSRFSDTFRLGEEVRPNPQAVDWDRVRDNLRQVQARQGLPVDGDLAWLEGTAEVGGGPAVPVRFPNFTVEMETGTGKTYVYLRTALELYLRYGFRKFIVVVPSVAVREGVIKTLQVTDRHFRALYQNPPYRYGAYDAGKLSRVRQFALSDGLEILVMTIQAFQGDRTVLRQERDQLLGARPLHLIQATRPILILDEPQNMESEDRVRALADLNPLFALRYSATHRHLYNLVYRLTPLAAYRQGLVKKIEVAGLAEAGAARPYIELVAVRRAPRRLEARVRAYRLRAGGAAALGEVTVRSGDDLEAKTRNPLYRGYRVDEVSNQCITFTNGLAVPLGQAVGPDREAVFRAQIRYTLETHLLKQRQLAPHGIKVLSLFFVDRVKSYVGEDGQEGLVRRLFREEFAALTQDPAYADWQELLPSWRGRSPDELQAAYFAARTRRGGVAYYEEESSREAREAFQQAYRLIMQEKERLISFDEPVAFLFSHSALREGWDNPNIFQICTLNESASPVRKRQEIGRGVRLCVNQRGERVRDPALNRLTVVASQSYAEYARQLQAEFAAEGTEGYQPAQAPARPGDRPRDTYRRLRDLNDPDVALLCQALQPGTRYRVEVDTHRLVQDAAAALARAGVPPPQVAVGKAVLEAGEGGLLAVETVRPRAYGPAALAPVPNLLDLAVTLLQRASPPLLVTRRTLLAILQAAWRPDLAANPHGLASALAQAVRQALLQQWLEPGRVRYERVDLALDPAQVFPPARTAYRDRLVREAGGRPLAKCLYEAVEVDSTAEAAFVAELERDPRVLLYAKLPGGYGVPTPFGTYHPDWAIVVEERDAHGRSLARVAWVHETKAAPDLHRLRPEERGKIVCAQAHFQALGVRFTWGPRWSGWP